MLSRIREFCFTYSRSAIRISWEEVYCIVEEDTMEDYRNVSGIEFIKFKWISVN